MVRLLREPFFRWILVGFSVPLASMRLDPGRSKGFAHFFGGIQSDLDGVFGLSEENLCSFRLWLGFPKILAENNDRSAGDSRIPNTLLRMQQDLESGGLWKDSRLQTISFLTGLITDWILEIADVSRDGGPGISVVYFWQSNRCNPSAFLFQSQFRRSHLLALISRFDLILILKGYDFLNLLLNWQLRVYKKVDSEISENSFAFHYSGSFLSLRFCAHLFDYCVKVSFGLTSGSSLVNMSQGSMLGKQSVEKSLSAVVSKLRIKIPSFDNSALIKGYAKTMIGRCMYPQAQDMKSLLFMFPRIWQMEGHVVGADLGLGRFQFDFDNEEDIIEVLKMEPFHFDYWMVSLVRWEPTVDPAYPSALKFWVRVLGVPLQFWADPTFRSIGDALGKVVDDDIDGGRVQVILDGFKPLCFDTMIEFGNGEETLVSLRYEKLYGYCSFCFSMCHDVEFCERKHGVSTPASSQQMGGSSGGTQSMSYKTAVTHDKPPHSGSDGKGKGIMSGKDRDGDRRAPIDTTIGPGRGNQGRFHQGETSSRYRRFTSYAQFNEHRHRKAKAKEATSTKMVPRDAGTEVQIQVPSPKKLVRKALDFAVEGPVVAGQNMITTDLVEETTQVEALEEQVPPNHVLHQTDLELGEIILVDTGSYRPAGVEERQGVVVGYAEDTEMKESDQAAALSGVPSRTGLDQAEGHPALQDTDNLEALPEGDDGEFGGDSELCNIGPEAELEEVSDITKDKAAPLGKKKNGKGTMVLLGANSRKRNVQALATPHKRPIPKDGASLGDAANPKNQDKEKGNPGGTKPPKSTA